jgi:F-type H+-transporting ATPase subunit b
MLRIWRPFLLTALAALLTPAIALAEGGDLMEPRYDLGIWTIIIFLVLLGVLWWAAWKPMLEGLRKREDSIVGSLEEAKRTREEMEQLRTRFKAEMDAEYAKIPKLMDDARKDAQQMAEEIRTKAAAEIQADRQRLRHELDVAKDQALHELWTSAAQLATLISAKAIGRSLSEDDHRRLIDEALQEIQESRS